MHMMRLQMMVRESGMNTTVTATISVSIIRMEAANGFSMMQKGNGLSMYCRNIMIPFLMMVLALLMNMIQPVGSPKSYCQMEI